MAGILSQRDTSQDLVQPTNPVDAAFNRMGERISNWWNDTGDAKFLGEKNKEDSVDGYQVDAYTGADEKSPFGDRFDQIPTDKPKKTIDHDPVTPDAKKIYDEALGLTLGEFQAEQDKQEPKPNYKEVVATPKANKTFSAGHEILDMSAPDVEMHEGAAPHTPDEFRSKYNTEKGRQTADFMNSNKDWYEDRSFYQGLFRWGLGVLGGEDYGTAFDNASQVYEKEHGIDQRQEWAAELSGDYDPRSIQKWIETGDEKDLQSYETMADDANKRQMNIEDQLSRMSVTDRKEANRLGMQQKAQDLENSKYQRMYSARSEQRAADRADREQAKFDATYVQNPDGTYSKRPTAGKGAGKPTELQQRAGIFASTAALNEDPMLDYIPSAMEDVGSTIGSLVTPDTPAGVRLSRNFTTDDAARAQQVKSNYIQGLLRIASGGAYGKLEMSDWENITIPQSDDPEEKRRKFVTRQVLVQQLGQTAAGKEPMPISIIQGISSGAYQPRFNAETKQMVAVTDPRGQIVWRVN